MLNVHRLACRSLAIGPSPTESEAGDYTKLLLEEPYCFELEAGTFLSRRGAVDVALPIGDMPILFQRPHRAGRAEAPLFTTPDALRDKVEAMLPPEARICLDQGLCGWIRRTRRRLARWLVRRASAGAAVVDRLRHAPGH